MAMPLQKAPEVHGLSQDENLFIYSDPQPPLPCDPNIGGQQTTCIGMARNVILQHWLQQPAEFEYMIMVDFDDQLKGCLVNLAVRTMRAGKQPPPKPLTLNP